MLAAGVICFLGFIAIMGLFFIPMLRHNLGPRVVQATIPVDTSTPGFMLPPTWTATPEQVIIPTRMPTTVALGMVPTPMYTPRPTSLPGLPFKIPFVRGQLSVVDLARIMQGESPGDREAAYMVGWVAKNRLLHPSYGDNYAVVSNGFFGYLDGVEPNNEFKDIAYRVIRSNYDPTDGSLYALSRTDITKLGVPPHRADVAYGEWFFFKTWPLNAR